MANSSTESRCSKRRINTSKPKTINGISQIGFFFKNGFLTDRVMVRKNKKAYRICAIKNETIPRIKNRYSLENIIKISPDHENRKPNPASFKTALSLFLICAKKYAAIHININGLNR